MELQEVLNALPKTQVHGGIVTAFGLVFAWLILGRLVDLLLELIWMVWVGLTVSATCYLPTVWVYKRSNRVSMKKIMKKKLTFDEISDKQFYAELASEARPSSSNGNVDITNTITQTESEGIDVPTNKENNINNNKETSSCTIIEQQTVPGKRIPCK